VLLVGLDTRFARSVVGVALRTAMKDGIEIFTIHPREHTFSLKADVWLQPRIGDELLFLSRLAALTGGQDPTDHALSVLENERLERIARSLSDARNPVILIGAEFLQYDSSPRLLNAIARIAENIGAGVMPLPAQNNFTGSLLTGTYPELLPGMRASSDEEQIRTLENLWGTPLAHLTDTWNSRSLLTDEKPMQFLYAIGAVPPAQAPSPEFLVFQNMYPPEAYITADLVLPSAAATEVDGSFINGERRPQRVRRAVPPIGNALPDWQILCRLARFLGADGFAFARPEEIREEMTQVIPGFTEEGLDTRHPLPITSNATLRPEGNGTTAAMPNDAGHPFRFHAGIVEHTHRGFPLAAWVEGAKMLFTEGVLEISPADAETLQLCDGDAALVQGASFENIWRVRIVQNQPRGAVHAAVLDTTPLHPNPQPVSVRKTDV
jgi:predicted molibdopterin-dependent oxidoreductase YjgC